MWYINQEIICPKIQDKIFKIKNLKKSKCDCKSLTLIDVGIIANGSFDKCDECGVINKNTDNIFWYSETLFKPKIN